MGQINWDEFKHYKQTRDNPQKLDNFQLLLEFIRSYYNKSSVYDIFDMLSGDDLSVLMLQKREITEPEQLERYLFKKLRS